MKLVARFAAELKLSPLIARILTLRGFTDNDFDPLLSVIEFTLGFAVAL